MANRREPTLNKIEPRLYLVTPAVEDAAAFSRDLAACLDTADVAAVLLRLAPTSENELTKRAKIITPIVQDKGAALLLDSHAQLAARTGVDGVHLTGIEAFNDAAQNLKPEKIVGVGNLHTRHDAMVAAERGADYVMFGEPDARGARPSLDAIIERVAWWAEVFEVPCVAFAATLDEIAPLAAAGADFIAAGDCIWTDKRGAPAAIAAAMRSLMSTEAVT